MTTRPTFDLVGSERGQTTLDEVRVLLAGPELPGLLPPGTIGTQSAGQGSGLPMTALRRGLLGPLKGRTSGGDYSVTSVAFIELDSAKLSGTLVCTGRPVRIDISASGNRGTTNGLVISVAMDGKEVTGVFDGMASIYGTTTDTFLSGWTIITPRPGVRRFAFVAQIVTGGVATLYSSTNDLIQLAVTEL